MVVPKYILKQLTAAETAKSTVDVALVLKILENYEKEKEELLNQIEVQAENEAENIDSGEVDSASPSSQSVEDGEVNV
jgi:antitoxin component of MazEF toxin-antitoxin module